MAWRKKHAPTRHSQGMRDELPSGIGRVLVGVPSPFAERAAEILAASASVELEPGEPHSQTSFPTAALLAVEEGAVVLRASFPSSSRSVITCEAGAGRLLLPPVPDQVLYGLVRSRVRAISAEDRDRLLVIPAIAQLVVEQMAFALRQQQEVLANFAHTRHVERVRRKLLQLARGYGRVNPDGIRIDFPVSHAVLAEMIGSSRETVTRAVDELQRDGFVARRGHTYQLLVSPESVLGARP
jgi:biotin operon repressor